MNNTLSEMKGISFFIYLLWIIFILLSIRTSDVIASDQSVSVQPDGIKIFYTNNKKIKIGSNTKKLSVEQFNLDTVDMMEGLLSKNLPSNPKQAEKTAQRRADKLINNQELLDGMRQGYEGIIVANAIGVKKVPAIVFMLDKELFVVYGERNSDIALKQFQKYIKNRNR